MQRLVECLGFLGSRIGRMRIKLGKHAHNGILNELLLIDRVHIKVGNGHLSHLQLAELAVAGEIDFQLCAC